MAFGLCRLKLRVCTLFWACVPFCIFIVLPLRLLGGLNDGHSYVSRISKEQDSRADINCTAHASGKWISST
jgi:hypothetical protein